MSNLENDDTSKKSDRKYCFVEPQDEIKELGDEASDQIKELAGSLERIKESYILLEEYLQNIKNILSAKSVAPKNDGVSEQPVMASQIWWTL
jgi:hypothetical protein